MVQYVCSSHVTSHILLSSVMQCYVLIGKLSLSLHSIVFLGPLIGIVSGVSLIPLILTFIFAVYATGYIREVIKGHHLTTCLGYSCSLFVSYICCIWRMTFDNIRLIL